MLQDYGRCLTIAEIGINHNGDIDTAKQLIRTAKDAGFDFVKFQKRTIDVVYTKEELDKPREHPFGTTNGDLKRHLEFSYGEYKELDHYCSKVGIKWTASPWDEGSVDFLMQFDLPVLKIASASITDKDLLVHMARTKIPLWVSTGGCDILTIQRAIDVIESKDGIVDILFYCNSTYPCPTEELNLLGIQTLNRVFPEYRIGYSGHEAGVETTIMAAVLGTYAIERHITLNRAMFGSDQAASLEPVGMRRLIQGIRAWELARGDGTIEVNSKQAAVMQKLRRKMTL